MQEMRVQNLLIVGPLLALLVASQSHGLAQETTAKYQTNTPQQCMVSCIEPHTACSESEKVIEALKQMIEAITQEDIDTYAGYLDDECTTFDEGTKRLVVGKQNVVLDMKRKIQKHAQSGPTPLVAYTIDHPYAKVSGDTAVVTFVAIKEIGGAHPFKMQCHATDVFVKRGDHWKRLHFRGRWKKLAKQKVLT